MQIKYTSRGLKLSEPMQAYIEEKIGKHAALLKDALLIHVELLNKKANSGKEDDFKMEIIVNMPKAFIKVEESGSDIYPIVDKLETLLKRRLKRYHDLHRQWHGKKSWKVLSEPTTIKDVDDYTNYEPAIIKYKKYDDNTPKHPAEAIEQMELLGYNSYLFKNIKTNSYSMIYKRSDGNYGLIEPTNP